MKDNALHKYIRELLEEGFARKFDAAFEEEFITGAGTGELQGVEQLFDDEGAPA